MRITVGIRKVTFQNMPAQQCDNHGYQKGYCTDWNVTSAQQCRAPSGRRDGTGKLEVERNSRRKVGMLDKCVAEKKRGSETGESTETRLKKQKSYTSTSRSKESDDQRRVRLASMGVRGRQGIDQETDRASLHVVRAQEPGKESTRRLRV